MLGHTCAKSQLGYLGLNTEKHKLVSICLSLVLVVASPEVAVRLNHLLSLC